MQQFGGGSRSLLDIWDIIPSKVMINGLYERSDDVLYNTRTKYRLDTETGRLLPYERLVSRKRIFNPDHAEVAELTLAKEWRLAYDEANAELFGGRMPMGGNYKRIPDPAENLRRSQRRAKKKVFDLIVCNDFDCFVTLTLNPEQIDRGDYGAIMKRLNAYLDNRVRRKGLFYLGVPELHKNGGFHFHFLCNSAALSLADSGTVSCMGHKRPIKIQTADRLHIKQDDRHTVYNVTDWKLGFSTAIKTYGSPMAIGNYIGKYITKGEKVGGRWYYSGGDLRRPIERYENVEFDTLAEYTYGFEIEGCKYKMLRYDERGTAIYGD